jgi:group I intron endonuclease
MHKTKKLDDGYMGSGKLIRAAIKKYGVENFTKEILHVFDNEEDMKNKEKELVVLNEMSYNLCEGGKGGWGYVNKNGLCLTYSHSEAAKKNAMVGANKFSRMMKDDLAFRNKQCEILKNKHASKKEDYINPFLGRKHSDDTKQKLRGHKRQTGEKNSQFGKPRSEETKQKIRETLMKRRLEKVSS